MDYFTTRDEPFFIPLTLRDKEEENLFKFLGIIENSGVLELIEKHSKSSNGRPSYNLLDMLSTVLYGFAFSKGSLRDLEDSCNYDLRYIYLMNYKAPKHSCFGSFINNYIVPYRNEIFSLLIKAFIKELNIDISEVFIDGTKIEADANKYKFVWKPTTFHIKLSNKIRDLLRKYGLDNYLPNEGIIDSKIIENKLSKLDELRKQNPLNLLIDKDVRLLISYLLKALEYEEKERICGPNRNSYYKTDIDATAMCLKQDYYSGLGSSMHAAYNIQIAVSKGIIVTYYVSQSRSDSKDFISVNNSFFKMFNHYPKIVCADAGYGSYENYSYLKSNGILNYVKNNSWQGNISGNRPDLIRINDESKLVCLNNKEAFEIEVINHHPTRKGNKFYKVDNCFNCPFEAYCKKSLGKENKKNNYRIFETNYEYQLLKKEAETNLLSIKGIELRVNRSSQVEGAFGVIKEDMNYED